MVAVTLVLVFDQLIPFDRQPAFLNGSQLRPLLSAAGQRGFRVAAAGSRGRDRSAEKRPADIGPAVRAAAAIASLP
jgi:hypothetical protein